MTSKSLMILLMAVLMSPAANAAEATKKDVHIGLASNFSEPSSSSSNPYGDYFRNGVRLALVDATSKLAKAGINIVLDEFDYGTNQVRVLDAARKAVASPVIGVFGYNLSSHALLAGPIHQAAKLPLLTPSATADRIGQMGRYVHMNCFDNRFMGQALASVAWNRLKAKNVAVIVSADCAYCMDLAKGFENEFQTLGGSITIKKQVLESDHDFTSVVKALKEAPVGSFDAILVPNQQLTSAQIISAVLKADIHTSFLGGDGWGNVTEEFFAFLGKENINGFSVSHWHADLKTKRSKKFLKDFNDKFKKHPNDTAVLAYDGMLLMIEALLKAKEFTRDGLENSLSSIKTFDGITGRSHFMSGRAPIKSLTLISVKNGRFTPVGQIDPKISIKTNHSETK